MIDRWQSSNLIDALNERRGVHLTGVRQCGKTTLAESLSLPSVRQLTLDDEVSRKSAEADPTGFIARRCNETVVIDEIQKVPALLDAIKIGVDHCNERGQYLITGSSNLRFAKSITDSLAGRFEMIRLRTLALGELKGGKGTFLDRVLKFDFPDSFADTGKRDIINLAFKGGYPEVLNLSERRRIRWFASYANDLLTKDIADITEIRKVDSMRSVFDWLLAHSSKFFEIRELASKSGVGVATVENYISALKALYVCDEVPAWTNSDYAKIGKRSKYYITDSAIMANLLGWNEDQVYSDDDKSGKFVESWVYHELACLADLNPLVRISQYRDSNKREIDFLIEGLGDEILGIEVKAGSVVGIGDFAHMKWFASNIANKPFRGIVLYSGTRTLGFGERFMAVPLAALGM